MCGMLQPNANGSVLPRMSQAIRTGPLVPQMRQLLSLSDTPEGLEGPQGRRIRHGADTSCLQTGPAQAPKAPAR